MVNVSVIVPVYNVEKYIRRCLDSLVSQTLNDIEIILVNDASTDNSLSIMREFESTFKNIKVIDSKINLKQGGARNIGIQAAIGDYIGFVDSDDWISSEMYQKLYNKAIESNSDVVVCDYYVSDGINILEVHNTNTEDQIGEITFEKKKSLLLNSGPIWAKIYKRNLFVENNIAFPEKLFYEDNVVGPLVLMYAIKLEKVKEPLYYYFKNLESTTTIRNSHHHFDRLKTSIILVEEFKKRGLNQEFQEEIEHLFSMFYYINTISICLCNFDTPEINRLYEIRDYMKLNFSNYRQNKYFERISSRTRLISKLNDISPYIMVKTYKLYRKIKRI